eukprot:g78087.t1
MYPPTKLLNQLIFVSPFLLFGATRAATIKRFRLIARDRPVQYRVPVENPWQEEIIPETAVTPRTGCGSGKDTLKQPSANMLVEDNGLDLTTRVSFCLSLILLLTALPLNLQLLSRIYYNRETCHVLQLAMGWLLLADLLLILNFGSHHLISLMAGHFMDGGYCIAGGYWSMVMVTFSNAAAAGIAVVTNKSMSMDSRAFGSWFRRYFSHITLLMFIPGIIYASVLAGTAHIGNYRNLYCCMVDNGNAWVVWGGFLIFFVCASIQAHQYYWSYSYVKRQMEKSSASNQDEATRMRFIQGIRDHALRMAALFYVAWFPMMLTSLIAYAHGGVETHEGEAFQRGVDVFVVLTVKIVPLLDCYVIKRSLDRASDNKSHHDSAAQKVAASQRPAHRHTTGNKSQTGVNALTEESAAGSGCTEEGPMEKETPISPPAPSLQLGALNDGVVNDDSMQILPETTEKEKSLQLGDSHRPKLESGEEDGVEIEVMKSNGNDVEIKDANENDATANNVNASGPNMKAIGPRISSHGARASVTESQHDHEENHVV